MKKLLKNKFSFTDRETDFFISILSEAADEIYHPVGVLSGICRDPDDDLVLLCAQETKAGFIVTGDNDLLVLKDHQNTKIIKPRDFELLFED
jgi:putative PIN family toxin of toxin-antitoxin system